jgi:hypothetical protein
MSGNKAKRMVLQKRDLEFFKILGRDARLVDREQAMKFAGFTSQTRANVRLLKLTANGFLRRYFLGTYKGAKSEPCTWMMAFSTSASFSYSTNR